MLAHRLIERKRDGGRLDNGEWRALIMAYAAGHVPDYQMSAMLMAIALLASLLPSLRVTRIRPAAALRYE